MSDSRYGMLYIDMGVMDLIRKHAEELAVKSQNAKDAIEYGAAEDIFVSFVMAYLGYKRDPYKSLKDLTDRKEIWRKEGEENGTL